MTRQHMAIKNDEFPREHGQGNPDKEPRPRRRSARPEVAPTEIGLRPRRTAGISNSKAAGTSSHKFPLLKTGAIDRLRARQPLSQTLFFIPINFCTMETRIEIDLHPRRTSGTGGFTLKRTLSQTLFLSLT